MTVRVHILSIMAVLILCSCPVIAIAGISYHWGMHCVRSYDAAGENLSQGGGIEQCSKELDDVAGRKQASKSSVARLLVIRGIAYLAQGGVTEAIADFTEAISQNPNNINAFFNRGRAYDSIHDIQHAREDFNTAVNIPITESRGSIDDLVIQGRAYMALGNLDQAVLLFTMAIGRKEEPWRSRAWALLFRGLAYEGRGDTKHARQDFIALLTTPDVGASYSFDDPVGSWGPMDRAQAQAGRHLAALDVAQPPVEGEVRIALVIANSNYTNVSALPNPRNDGAAVAKALEAAGFRVTLRNDLNHEQLNDALALFATESEKADWAIVYYAGHGLEMAGTNYLVPIDAKLATDTSVKFEAVALDEVMTAVEGAHKLRLVILDACRANPFVNHMHLSAPSRAPLRGLGRPPETDPGELIVYSAKDGEVASDGDSGSSNSPFAGSLIRELLMPGTEVRRVFDLVRDDVIAATGNHQHPFTYGSLPGREDFFFVKK